MSGDDCIKVIAAVGLLLTGVLAALAKLYASVSKNGREIDRLHRRVTMKS